MKGKPFIFFILWLTIVCLFVNDSSSWENGKAPSVNIGMEAGFSRHNVNIYDEAGVDATTGATPVVADEVFYSPIVELNTDIAFVQTGSFGNFGARLLLDLSAPRYIYSFGIQPRYRMEMIFDSEILKGIAPWIGIGANFAVVDRFSDGFSFNMIFTGGFDISFFDPRLWITLNLSANYMSPYSSIILTEYFDGQPVKVRKNYDNINLKIGFSYRLY
jgi:hypothetical protein